MSKQPIILGVTSLTADFNIGSTDTIEYEMKFITREVISPTELNLLFANQYLSEQGFEMSIDELLRQVHPDKFI